MRISSHQPSGFTSALKSKHFPPFEARDTSGSGCTFVIFSSFMSSLVWSKLVLYLDMFLIFAILAAVIGTVFENSALSRIALAERQIGGRKRDIKSADAFTFRDCVLILASVSKVRPWIQTSMAA